MITASCEESPQTSLSGATAVTTVAEVSKNARGLTVEQQNIQDRISITTDPTKVMWIHLIALDGKIIRRMPVRNKVTSSGKRLEPVTAALSQGWLPDVNGTPYKTEELLQPDGTFGSSDPYIFWFDPTGRYHQYGTAGGIGYLLTDYPIDLANPVEEITGLYNADKAASEWQVKQEQALRAKEGDRKAEKEGGSK